MPRLSLLPTIIRETLGRRTLPREPEPDLIMDGEEQVAAYSEAGRIDGVMAAAYLFHSARISGAIQGCKKVIDLGCGPATQLAQVAELNPDIQFQGVDLSPSMLESARRYVSERALSNVTFGTGDITKLESIPDASVDGVVSTMALHHLPTLQDLTACFRQIRRILHPGGSLYLADFGRLKSLRSVIFFAYMNAEHQPHLFSLDYERSLRAAFRYEDLKSAAERELAQPLEIHGTFLSPMLTVIQTRAKSLPDALSAKIRQMRRALPSRYRSDLDDLRLFFRLGGLRTDPFR
jgi:ubiquinone/menaquinone biosynthesis C-methylase UbiE